MCAGYKPSEADRASTNKEDNKMLWTIFVILIILWVLGLSTGILGNLIYLLLVAAVIVLIVNLVTGRRSV
jgi:hypothetical protein